MLESAERLSLSNNTLPNLSPSTEYLLTPEEDGYCEKIYSNGGLPHKISISSPHISVNHEEDESSSTSSSPEKPRMGYKEIVHHCESTSTFHGICHAGNALNEKSALFWHVIFLICFSLLCIQMVYLFQKYLQYDKTVDLDLKFENASFPAVTFCNLNPYKASAIAQDPTTRNTMDMFVRKMAPPPPPPKPSKKLNHGSVTVRRYYQVFTKCFCEMVSSPSGNKIASERSCFPGFMQKLQVDLKNDTQSVKTKASKCLCQFDFVSKTLWPCFPIPVWEDHDCKECSRELGHCPMRFSETSSSVNSTQTSPCKCNADYNHCIANNDEKNYTPEVVSADDLQSLFEVEENTTEAELSTTTAVSPDVIDALGFTDLTDEIAIASQAQQNLMFAVGEKILAEKIALSHSMEELILKCSFNQRDCDFERDFLLHHDPTYGNCYTFNWNRTNSLSVHRAGATWGLRILLYSNRSEYLPTSEAVGFRITIHDQWSFPFPDAFGYSAPTGFISSFGVRTKTFHRIPPPYGQCLDGGAESDFYVYKGYNYSLEGCHRSCTQNEISRVCGCADPLYPLPNNETRPCGVNDPRSRDCIKRVSQYINVAMNEGRLPNCSCHQPCSNIAYEVYYSAAGWPSGTTKILECEPQDDLCMEKYKKNAALIQVFYEELNQETLSESPAYTWMSLIADIGGLTGLWVGASVVSLFEIVMLAYYTIQERKKRQKQDYAKMGIFGRKYEAFLGLVNNLKFK